MAIQNVITSNRLLILMYNIYITISYTYIIKKCVCMCVWIRTVDRHIVYAWEYINYLEFVITAVNCTVGF